jgi:beta-glucosidase
MAFDMDYAGLQNYTREIVRHAFFMPFIRARPVKASKRNVEYTQMDWEVYPPSIFEAIMRWSQYENLKEIIVTENGAAFEDNLVQGVVHDPKRLNYIKKHIEQVLLARQAGARVNGYFVWTLLDNFEWAEGYAPKFGLVHVNFESQERIIKSSGKWYADFLRGLSSADIF